MKNLFLVRHAKSSWSYPELPDHDRPLNNRGKRNAPEMGKRLAIRNVEVDCMISSSAKRALDTALQFKLELNFQGKIDVKKSLYHAYPQTLLKEIRNFDSSLRSAMVFGHNPGITELANFLTQSEIDNVPTTGVIQIEFDIDFWTQVSSGTGNLVDFDYPKKIRV